MQFLPHAFRPEFPITGDAAFLFTGIEERVESAEVVRQEQGCDVVSVRYAPSKHASFMVPGPPVLFWVRTEDRMVMRQQGRIGHRHPTEDDISWSVYTTSVESVSIDEDLRDEAFRFTPPPDAVVVRRGMGTAGGVGFIEHSGDDARRIEHRGSHSWEGDTLVEHSRLKMRGMVLEFERRLTFSADGTELRVGERLSGPKGSVDGEFVLPVG
jgi:hypothetical protein